MRTNQLPTRVGDSKRLSAIIVAPNGQVNEETKRKMGDRARRLSGASQTILVNNVLNKVGTSAHTEGYSCWGQTCYIFEIYVAAETGLIHRIGYRLREWLAAAFDYLHLGDPFVRIVFEI